MIIIDECSRSRYSFYEAIKFACFKPILMKIFAKFGILKTLTSDNGPPFSGSKFEILPRSHHKTTSYWPEANGRAKRGIKTLKKSLL